MSQWTHVAGVIRLDSMGAPMVRLDVEPKNKVIKEAAARALGNTCDFDSSAEEHARCSVPKGSEGSLQYRVHPNSDEDTHSLSWGYAAIWGDLRDFGLEGVPGIQKWFQRSLERLQKPEGYKSPGDMEEREKALYMLSTFSIRGAILSVDVEHGPQIIMVWDEDTRKVVRANPSR